MMSMRVCATAERKARGPNRPRTQNRQTAVRVQTYTHDVSRSSDTTTTLLRIHFDYIQQQQREINPERLHFDYIRFGGVVAG